jgi:hypothetical protein
LLNAQTGFESSAKPIAEAVGFAFVGSQYRIQVGEDEFFVDLLFYHLKLRAFVVIDLKMQPFRPEFAGKMNFYLSAVNEPPPSG